MNPYATLIADLENQRAKIDTALDALRALSNDDADRVAIPSSPPPTMDKRPAKIVRRQHAESTEITESCAGCGNRHGRLRTCAVCKKEKCGKCIVGGRATVCTSCKKTGRTIPAKAAPQSTKKQTAAKTPAAPRVGLKCDICGATGLKQLAGCLACGKQGCMKDRRCLKDKDLCEECAASA